MLPWEARERQEDMLESVVRPLLGSRLSRVRYVVPSGEVWPAGHLHSRVHEVDMGVEVATHDGALLAVSWAMEGLNEGLAVDWRPDGRIARGDFVATVDMSGHQDWWPFLGGVVNQVALSWHVPNEGCPEAPWSLRIGMADSSSVVFALGEAKGGGVLGYQPDAILVIFDESTARSYRIPASPLSSWGEVIAAV